MLPTIPVAVCDFPWCIYGGELLLNPLQAPCSLSVWAVRLLTEGNKDQFLCSGDHQPTSKAFDRKISTELSDMLYVWHKTAVTNKWRLETMEKLNGNIEMNALKITVQSTNSLWTIQHLIIATSNADKLLWLIRPVKCKWISLRVQYRTVVCPKIENLQSKRSLLINTIGRGSDDAMWEIQPTAQHTHRHTHII